MSTILLEEAEGAADPLLAPSEYEARAPSVGDCDPLSSCGGAGCLTALLQTPSPKRLLYAIAQGQQSIEVLPAQRWLHMSANA